MDKYINQPTNPIISTRNSQYIALIGCGAIAESYYLPVLARQQSVLANLTLVDQNIERAWKLAETFNVKLCLTDYHEVLDKVDGAIIALPTHLHHPVSMEFLTLGVPVLCEKPLAESASQAREMVQVAKKKDTFLAVNYFQRLIPVFAQVKEWVTEKKFGDLQYVKYVVGEEFKWPSVSGFYFNSPISARGILRDRGAHALDHICWWLGGKPKVISSQNDSFGGSEAVAYVRFEMGQCTGEVRLSWLENTSSRYKITCEKGTILGDVYDYKNLTLGGSNSQKKQIHLNSKEKTKLDIAQKVITNFLNILTKGDQPLVSGNDVLESVELIDECYAVATRFSMPWYDRVEVKNVP